MERPTIVGHVTIPLALQEIEQMAYRRRDKYQSRLPKERLEPSDPIKFMEPILYSTAY